MAFDCAGLFFGIHDASTERLFVAFAARNEICPISMAVAGRDRADIRVVCRGRVRRLAEAMDCVDMHVTADLRGRNRDRANDLVE